MTHTRILKIDLIKLNICAKVDITNNLNIFIDKIYLRRYFINIILTIFINLYRTFMHLKFFGQ